MKARLANKICRTPIDRISDYWLNACRMGKDERINTAIRIYRKRERHERETTGNGKGLPQGL